MDFSSSSESLSNPLTPQQLHDLHFLQGEQQDDFFRPDMDIDDDVNMANNNNNNHGGIASDSIFWGNNYTSQQQLTGVSPTPATTTVMDTKTVSPLTENQIEHCIKKEVEASEKRKQEQEQQQQQQLLINADQPEISEEELALRRKAQNRALQRLFRERKESKLKELSSKLSKTEMEKERLLKEIEALRRQNTVLVTENQVLLKSGSIVSTAAGSSSPEPIDTNAEFSFPINKKMFINDLILNTEHDIKKAHQYDKLIYEHEGNKILSVGAVWDYLHQYSAEHEELEIDIGKVMNFLKGSEKCHGYGPGFQLVTVKELIANVIDS